MFFMIEQVLNTYDFTVNRTLRGRGVLICYTDKGMYALKEFGGTQTKAEYLQNLGRYLTKNGLNVDEMIPNKEGNLIVMGPDGISYTMHHWYEGKECDIKCRGDILASAALLARMHQVLNGYSQPPEGFDDQNAGAEYARHNRELKKIRSFVKNRRQKNEFERGFLTSFDLFWKQAEEVEREICQGRPENTSLFGICHGNFNYHNVLFETNRMALLNFEQSGWGVQISDLSNFVRKIMEKHNWNERLGKEVIRTYERVRPLSEEEERQLYLRLAYPEKFWKIMNHYYNSNKVWVSGRNMEKLQKEIQQNEAREKFLKGFHFLGK